MKVDLKVTNNKMSLKKVEETEFQRTARILGVLFPAPPISSATSIPGPGSYCLDNCSSSFPANQFCKCSLTQATMWPKGVPHKATQLQTPLPAIWRWQFIEKSKTIIRFTKHKKVSTPIPRLPALPHVMRASVYFCQTGRRFLVNHPPSRYTQ